MAEILSSIWTVTVGVVLVIIGFNALVIVHEFGHFAVARLCGVRCEKFYIWFDFWGLKFFKFKWGDTEYGLGLFPLGGYVKMLGQEDDPGAIRAEIERAKLQNQNENTAEGQAAQEQGGGSPLVQTDSSQTEGLPPPALEPNVSETRPSIFAPDSYLSKSVPQRLAIIVAGVAMNFLFAIVCAAGAFMLGVEESTPAVGNVFPGSPAWEAGVQAGDRITAIDGKPATAFQNVLMKMLDGSESVKLDIKRQGSDGHQEALTVNVSPRRREGDLTPNVGIGSMPILELGGGIVLPPWDKSYPAETLETLKKLGDAKIEKVDGQDVKAYVEYHDAQLKKIGQPITCTINGTEIEIPATPMRTIPVRFKMGTIVSVLPGSDAAKQGIAKGDVIVSVDSDANVDPLKLPQVLLQKVNAEQKSVELVIKKADGEEQTLTVELKPIRIYPELSAMSMQDPLGSTALGLSWNVEPVIAGVDTEALPADEPMPQVGDKVVGMELVNCVKLLERNSFSEPTNTGGFFIHDIGSKIDMPYIIACLLQDAHAAKPRKGEEEKTVSVRLILESADGDTNLVNLPIVNSTDWYHTERGFLLKPELTISKANGLGEALSRGTAQMIEHSKLVYRSLNALVNGTVSTKALNGPVGIVKIMYKIAKGDWSRFLMLLCLIGANLAVINIFPIPPLDGGHVLFLLYEGIFRRAPNELIQVVLSYFGLFLILLLMVWTLALDLTCITRW